MPSSHHQGEPLLMAGVITEITSYSTARGHVLVTQGYTRLVTYGSLVEIEDSEDPSKRYLAVVSDVREKGILPSIDQKALEEIIRTMQVKGVDPQRVSDVLRELAFPGVQRQYGLREVDLQILGEVERSPKGEVALRFHKRPPRPYSRIKEAAFDLLNGLTARDCSYLVLGSHYVVDGALVTLNPQRLTMHLAIVGQTGSGKTETVKRIALEYYVRGSGRQNPRTLVIFDVAGEYLGYPYRGPAHSRAVPLLEALLEPTKYICEPRSHCGSVSPPTLERLTILVPYDPSKTGLDEAHEKAYMQRYKQLLDYVNGKLATLGRAAGSVLFGRHHIYTLTSKGLQVIGTFDAWNSILNSEYLVIALPLPDALTIDEIVEISGTRSEYVPVLLRSAANALGLLEGNTIAGITFLFELFELFTHKRFSGRFKDLAEKIVNAIKDLTNKALSKGASSLDSKDIRILLDDAVCNSLYLQTCRSVQGGSRPTGKSLKRSTHYYNIDAWLYYLTLPLWKGWANIGKPPFDPASPQTVLAALKAIDPIKEAEWEKAMIDRFADFEHIVGEWEKATQAATLNVLRKASILVAPTLNHYLYREVVKRFLEKGVTFTLLAPPSTGATEFSVARMLDEIFAEAVEEYDPQAPRMTLLILEEAHNLAPAKKEPPTKSGVLRIAREGRKWGIGLVLVTQRPGFVDPDVLSQAATLIALRTTNPEDIASLRRSVESVTSELAERLPDLEPGQAIVSGLAVPERRVPLLARIAMLGSHQEICGSGPQQGPP